MVEVLVGGGADSVVGAGVDSTGVGVEAGVGAGSVGVEVDEPEDEHWQVEPVQEQPEVWAQAVAGSI